MSTYDFREQALDLIIEATGNNHFVLTNRTLLEFMDNDLQAAILLNQILYWTDRTTDPQGWFYKTYSDWHKETGMSAYQVRRAVNGDKRVKNPKKNLSDVGLETRVRKAPNGNPTVHYRLDVGEFFGHLTAWLEETYPHELPDVQPMTAADMIHEEVPELLDVQPAIVVATDQTMCADTPKIVESVDANQHLAAEQCEETILDNVEEPPSTMFTNENEHCESSSIKTKNTPENTTESTSSPTHHPDERIEHNHPSLKRAVAHFGEPPKRFTGTLSGSISRLGAKKVSEVIDRCINAQGRSWQYIATALEREHDVEAVEKMEFMELDGSRFVTGEFADYITF